MGINEFRNSGAQMMGTHFCEENINTTATEGAGFRLRK
jgi:hypothetical protein